MSPALILACVGGYFAFLLLIAWFTSRNASNASYFLGNKADYDISVNDDGSLTVKFIGKDEPVAEGEEPKAPKVNEGTDHLVDIETLRFADGTVKVEQLVAEAAAAAPADRKSVV